MTRTLVIGYGNPLRGDDGVGWHAAQHLAHSNWTKHMQIIVRHQLDPELAVPISLADQVIFIDASEGEQPGEVKLQHIDPHPSSPGAFTHHLEPGALLACARDLYGSCPDATLFTITGESFGFREGLSRPVLNALPGLLDQIEDCTDCDADTTRSDRAWEIRAMHEFAIVESMVNQTLTLLPNAEPGKVTSVRFRRGSTFSEDALRQSFEALTKGTALENAALIIDTVDLQFHCPCGHQQVVTSDDLIGHMFVCPSCGAVTEIDEAHDLELLEVLVDEPEVSGTGVSLK
ncbi:MAG: hydrogenase maturation protease [Anaerolineae bacterium]|nr:hydrogenase maturation protease [Anaerolineae bacterium]